jgi:hypothetical protein
MQSFSRASGKFLPDKEERNALPGNTDRVLYAWKHKNKSRLTHDSIGVVRY